MARLIVPQEDEAGLGASQSQATQLVLSRQRHRDTVQSVISSFIVVIFLGVILAIIAIASWNTKAPVIVTYQAPAPEEPELERPEVNQRARPNPPGQKSSRAKVIASTAPSPVSVPVPENPIPEGPFGMSDEIGEGWGDDEGDGAGGGGATFFGSYRKGKRIAYVVDFSGSMGSNAEGGGTFAEALKKELSSSIEGLSPGMQFSVIFFSSRAWTIDTDGPDYVGNGWNGLGESPVCNWYPATERIKNEFLNKLNSMPVDGGTAWYPPLRLAFSMNPPPSVVYLLSDGEPRDGKTVLDDLKEINPTGTPIDTIAFELPGSPAALLLEIAQNTGGKFSMVYKGELKSGRAAEALTDSKHD